MSNVPSQSYPKGYLLQLTTSAGLLTTVYIYRFTNLTIRFGPGRVLEAERIEILFKERILAMEYLRASRERKREIEREMVNLGGSYVVIENDPALRQFLRELFQEHGYPKPEAEYQALSWVGRLKPEGN